MLNELYQKTLKLAAHKKSNTYLAILSFTESSFFPIPPDVMIAPMVIAKKNDYLKILDQVKKGYELPEVAKKYVSRTGRIRKQFELDTLVALEPAL